MHGIASSWRYWQHLSRALAPRWRVLAVDLPGFGGSPHPPRPLTVPELGWALRDALAQRGATGALLVGHSMGAQVVTALAAADPRAARGLVLVGPTVDRAARRPLVQAARLLRNAASEPRPLALVQARSFAEAGPHTFAAAARHALADRVEEHLARVRVPVLVVRGAQDALVSRAWVRELVATAPDASAAEVAGAHHVVQWTHPRALARLCARTWERSSS